jgi:hypothetical protein
MRFLQALLFTSILCEVSLAAKYTVNLYTDSSCSAGKLGHRCTNLKKKTCCSDGSNRFKSSDFEEPGSTTCQDELRIYGEHSGDNCGLSKGQGDQGDCIKGSDIAGAMVYVVGNQRFRRDDNDGNHETVQPNQSFYENGTTRHVVDLNSPQGQAYLLLERREDKINYLLQYGKREEILAKRTCKGKKGSK